VGRAYLDHLLFEQKFDQAGKLCLKILGESWYFDKITDHNENFTLFRFLHSFWSSWSVFTELVTNVSLLWPLPTLCFNFITNCMELTSSREATGHSAIQTFPNILWIIKVHYHVDKPSISLYHEPE
jgi:hypothetical protein